MITPRFNLSQDDSFISINIRAPYCSLRELDVDVDGNIFIFVCKPYYLRLNLPGNIVENDRSKSSFDTDSGEFCFTYPKESPGERFLDLDLITKLLTPKVDADYNDGSIKIEILSESQGDSKLNDNFDINDLNYGFGFALRARKDFVRISSEFDEVFEIDPCEVPLQERRKIRLQYEQGKFNVDHYIADYIEDDEISEIISLRTPYSDLTPDTGYSFTAKELDFLKDLTNIDYNLSEIQLKYCHNSLIDILFAYCYDQRSTFFEGSIESGWTIVKLSATFSWLDAFETPKEALVSVFRRSVTYPLYRHFNLSLAVFEDLKKLLMLDQKFIIKALIEMYDIFLNGDCGRYILNNLFIKDYITYIMKWDKDLWKATVQHVLSTTIKKEDLGFNLKEIEDGFNLKDKFEALKIKENCTTCEDSDDSSSSDDSSEDSSSSDCSSESDSDDQTSRSVRAGYSLSQKNNAAV